MKCPLCGTILEDDGYCINCKLAIKTKGENLIGELKEEDNFDYIPYGLSEGQEG